MNFKINNNEENEISVDMPNSKFNTIEQKIETYRELLANIQSVVDYEIWELEFLKIEEQKKAYDAVPTGQFYIDPDDNQLYKKP